MNEVYDVVVIGAGVVGSAIARELAHYELSCALVEAGPDVGAGTSKANTAIWHTGFDAAPGSLEARLLRRSYPLFAAYAEESRIAVEKLGALLVAWTKEQAQSLPELLKRAHMNGVTDATLVAASETYDYEPHLNAGALGGLFVPGESILCTFTTPLALATQAVLNGVQLMLNFAVSEIEQEAEGTTVVRSAGGSVRCHYLVNAAGLYADRLNRLLGHADFMVTPRRGELIVFDKFARSLVNHIILPVPGGKTKGVLISPTVYGNVLLGPTAEDLSDSRDTSTSQAGLQTLLEKGRALMPALLQEEVTATYAGLRAATEHRDYQIHSYPGQRYVCVGGIRSTGVSACLGIAEYVVELLGEAGLPLIAGAEFVPVKMPYLGEREARPYRSAEMIARDAEYGRIVCHCEHVTLGEVRAALAGPLPARNLDGLRRRTRALQGRCQGFHCHAALASLLAWETEKSPTTLLNIDDNVHA